MPKSFDSQLNNEIITAIKNSMSQAEACQLCSVSSSAMSS